MINIFETSFEARERRFQIERLYHGETVDLVGVVTTDGVPQNITGYSVSGVFQPTSMNGSPDFYELSADIVDNKVIVHWEKGKDFGENSYMVWALLTDGDNASYPIVWRLDMAYSPSYPLSALDPIPRTIDFDKYDLLNAPWLPLSDVQSVEEDVLLSVSERYLPLSGGTIDGGLVVTSEISAENFTASIAKGVSIGDSSVSDNGVVIGFNSGTSHGSVAIGNGIESDGFGNTNIGLTSKSKGDFGIAIGQATEVSSIGIAIGYDSKAVVPGAVAIGTSAKATAKNAIQIGSTVVDESSWTEQVNSVPHSLKVMDKMVLSGDNLTLDPERVPYLSGYAKKEEIPEVPTDLSAFTNSPGYLTAHQSLEDYYTKQEADGKFLTAHQDLTDYATKEFVQSEISDFVTEDALTGLATKEEVQAVDDKLSNYAEKEELTAYAQLSDIPEVPEGDYLPLSGGTLSGRIYLNKTETRIVGSACVFTYQETESPYFGTIDSNVDVHFFVSLSVENAGQEFIDMLTNGEWTGEGTDYTVKAYVEVTEDWYATTKSTTVTGTVNFGDSHSSGAIDVYLDFPEYAEDESNLTINQIVFEENADPSPVIDITYDADWISSESIEEYLNISSDWTIETVSEEVTVNEPFVISSEIPEVSAFATKAEVSTKANESDLTALAHDVEDNYCTNQYASQTYATKNELTAYATKTYVQEYVAEHGGGGGGGGDYLPLSGGNLSGRIYLKTTTGGQTIDTSMVVGYYSDEECNAEISVYASEEDLRSGGGSAGASVNCYAKVYDKATDVSSDVSTTIGPNWPPNPDTEEEEYDGTWGAGVDYWTITVNAPPTADDGVLAANISWDDSENTGAFVDAYAAPLSNPTADTTVETTTPFVTSADVDAVLGDINSILDSINGQTI